MSLMARCPACHCHRKITASTARVICVMLMCDNAPVIPVLCAGRGWPDNAGVSGSMFTGSMVSGCGVCSLIQYLSGNRGQMTEDRGQNVVRHCRDLHFFGCAAMWHSRICPQSSVL